MSRNLGRPESWKTIYEYGTNLRQAIYKKGIPFIIQAIAKFVFPKQCPRTYSELLLIISGNNLKKRKYQKICPPSGNIFLALTGPTVWQKMTKARGQIILKKCLLENKFWDLALRRSQKKAPCRGAEILVLYSYPSQILNKIFNIFTIFFCNILKHKHF